MAWHLLTARRLPASFAAIVAAGVLATMASATDRTWNSSATGSFTTTTNWTPNGLPTSADKLTLRRGAAASYSVTYPGKVNFPFPVYEMNQLRVGSNTVTFSDALTGLQGPGTVNVTNATTSTGGRGVVIGVEDTDTAAVLTTTLAHFNAVAVTVGDVPSSVGTLNVNGGTFSITGSSATDDELVIGNQGLGMLTVNNGAHVNVNGLQGNVVVGKSPYVPPPFGPPSAITISGVGSQLNDSGNLKVGLMAKGKLTVANGGMLSTFTATISGSTQSTAEVSGAGSAWINADDLIVGGPLVEGGSGGSLVVSNGAMLQVGGGLFVEHGAYLQGFNGTITGFVASEGLVALSDAVSTPGTMHIIGDFSQGGAHGTLLLVLKDTTHHDRLIVSGDLDLGNELAVSAPSTPQDGDEFDVLDWGGSLFGQFSNVTLGDLPPALAWNASKLYTTGTVSIETALAADFDVDADVDQVDLALWKGGVGTSGSATHLQGDADRDHDVDGDDFLIWQEEFGSHAATATSSASVPEPGCATLSLVLGAPVVLASRRPRRR